MYYVGVGWSLKGLAVCVFNEVIMMIIVMSHNWLLFVFDVSRLLSFRRRSVTKIYQYYSCATSSIIYSKL